MLKLYKYIYSPPLVRAFSFCKVRMHTTLQKKYWFQYIIDYMFLPVSDILTLLKWECPYIYIHTQTHQEYSFPF